MGNIVLTRGIPASGKTTWAKAWVAKKPESRVRVNRDDLRRMLHGHAGRLDYAQEQQITKLQQEAVRNALARGHDVVVDDTNLRAKFVREWFKFGPVEFRDFNVWLEAAIERDAAREHPVGEGVIRSFHARFTRNGNLVAPPERPTGTPGADGEQYVPDWGLTPAIIVDIDGTLAHINPDSPRSPYDGSRVHEDLLDEHVAAIVNVLAETHRVIVLTGRDAEYRDVTERWLIDNNVQFDELWTRPEGDRRKDHVVKLEIFDRQIRNRFNVRAVFDDRNRVVQMWRSIGLKVLQVQEGDF